MNLLEKAIAQRSILISLAADGAPDECMDEEGYICNADVSNEETKELNHYQGFTLNSYAFICVDGWAERFINQACYSSLVYDVVEHLPARYFVDYSFGENMPVGGFKDAAADYLYYVLYRSPFRHAFVKDAVSFEEVLKGGAPIVDARKCSAQYAIGASIAIRQGSEMPRIVEQFSELRKHCVNEHLAFFLATLAHEYSCDSDKRKAMILRDPGGGSNHTVFTNYNKMGRKSLRAFIGDNPASINEVAPFSEDVKYNEVGPSWHRPSSRDYDGDMVALTPLKWVGETIVTTDSMGYEYNTHGVWFYDNLGPLATEFIIINKLEDLCK